MAIGRQPRLAVLAASLFLLTAACSPAPSPPGSPSAFPSQSAAGTPLPVGELADPPPAEIQSWLGQKMSVGFRPLTVSELALVRVPAATAKLTALAAPGVGYGETGRIVWTKVGCVYLGYYEGMPFPDWSYQPPKLPAYLVQVIGAPAPNSPGLNISLEVIDAEAGARITGFGYGGEPVLGTTCGVSP